MELKEDDNLRTLTFFLTNKDVFLLFVIHISINIKYQF